MLQKIDELLDIERYHLERMRFHKGIFREIRKKIAAEQSKCDHEFVTGNQCTHCGLAREVAWAISKKIAAELAAKQSKCNHEFLPNNKCTHCGKEEEWLVRVRKVTVQVMVDPTPAAPTATAATP